MYNLTSGVYKITNIINNKCYIGSALCFKKRWQRQYNKHLTSAFKKYGKANFKYEILLYCLPKNLIFYEQRAIDTYKPEYNVRIIADSNLGMKHSEETKRKCGIKNIGNKYSVGRIVSENTKEKLRVINTGKHHTEETKQKLSAILIGNKRGVGNTTKRGTHISLEQKIILSRYYGITEEIEAKVITLFTTIEKIAFREIARQCAITHKTVELILERNGII